MDNCEDQSKVKAWLKDTLDGMVQSVCDFDKRKWVTVVGGRESLPVVEALQKQCREYTSEPSPEEISMICHRLLRSVQAQIEDFVMSLN